MTATKMPHGENRGSYESDSTSSLVDVSSLSLQESSDVQPPQAAGHTDAPDYHLISHPFPESAVPGNNVPSTTTDKKARLLYCKSHVVIHPTAFGKDNISGYLGLVEVDGQDNKKKELLVTWVPDELLDRMDEEDKAGYKRVEERSGLSASAADREEDGFVFVSVPAPKGEKYAFSVPLSGVYSILVYAPSLTHWYGSATFNLAGGVSLPTLYFHDDESPMLSPSQQQQQQLGANQPHSTPNPRSQWGLPPFLELVRTRATLLRSRLFTPKSNHGAELWLVNPSKSDREVHEAGVEEEPTPVQPRRSSTQATSPYPPASQLPANPLGMANPKQTLLTSLSSITSFSRKAANTILSSPLAQQTVVPHLPPAVRSLVNVPGENGLTFGKKGGKAADDVTSEFESARLYLARWARVVAEEGERARKREVAHQANLNPGERVGQEDLASSLGVFSLLTSPNSKRPIPHPTRTPDQPITARDWDSFVAQGRDEAFVRQQIFRRGFSDSVEQEEKRARREGWELLLGILKWDEGGVGGGVAGKEKRAVARADARKKKREEYWRLREKWLSEEGAETRPAWKDEWHRIDVDCRRTDRNQKIFAVPTDVANSGNHEKEAGGAGGGWEPEKVGDKGGSEEGGAAKLNPHIAALRTILMTYHTYSPELGYVQGMSDLLSPIYVVFDANEADAFWGLVGVMKMMESNFLRDQSGMKRQLSTLQQLIGVMDPELYAHLERTGSLNLFFCFRWILISFKREFKFEQVIKLWEVLWTNYYSNQFVLFVALAILQSHRDVILRYLAEFDEVLKYANDLSGQIDLDTTLAQAEVLFLSFRGLLADLDRQLAAEEEAETSGSTLRKRRGSVVSVRSENGKVGRDVGELRDLLVQWPDATPDRPTEIWAGFGAGPAATISTATRRDSVISASSLPRTPEFGFGSGVAGGLIVPVSPGTGLGNASRRDSLPSLGGMAEAAATGRRDSVVSTGSASTRLVGGGRIRRVSDAPGGQPPAGHGSFRSGFWAGVALGSPTSQMYIPSDRRASMVPTGTPGTSPRDSTRIGARSGSMSAAGSTPITRDSAPAAAPSGRASQPGSPLVGGRAARSDSIGSSGGHAAAGGSASSPTTRSARRPSADMTMPVLGMLM